MIVGGCRITVIIPANTSHLLINCDLKWLSHLWETFVISNYVWCHHWMLLTTRRWLIINRFSERESASSNVQFSYLYSALYMKITITTSITSLVQLQRWRPRPVLIDMMCSLLVFRFGILLYLSVHPCVDSSYNHICFPLPKLLFELQNSLVLCLF